MLRLPWPLPALLAWGATWGSYGLLQRALPGSALPWVVASALGVLLSLAGNSWWRRAIIACGFPVSLLVSGAALLPSWSWLALLGMLALIYPINVWRDAPLFPTPRHALRALAAAAPLPPDAALLDAGCGLGAGLLALREAYPLARIHGVEWSWPLAAACALRCPWAHVRRGDIWRADWSSFALVYLFQRPESMARAVAKADAEMRAGSWLVSLEFEAQELIAAAVHRLPDRRPLWTYQLPFVRRSAQRPESTNH